MAKKWERKSKMEAYLGDYEGIPYPHVFDYPSGENLTDLFKEFLGLKKDDNDGIPVRIKCRKGAILIERVTK